MKTRTRSRKTMKRTKPSGFWKIRQDCGVCQKPKRYRKKVLDKDRLKEEHEQDIWYEGAGGHQDPIDKCNLCKKKSVV